MCEALASRHEVVTVGHKCGGFHVDIVARHARRYRGTRLSCERRRDGDRTSHRPSQCRGEVMAVRLRVKRASMVCSPPAPKKSRLRSRDTSDFDTASSFEPPIPFFSRCTRGLRAWNPAATMPVRTDSKPKSENNRRVRSRHSYRPVPPAEDLRCWVIERRPAMPIPIYVMGE